MKLTRIVDLFSGKGALRRDVPRAVPTRHLSLMDEGMLRSGLGRKAVLV